MSTIGPLRTGVTTATLPDVLSPTAAKARKHATLVTAATLPVQCTALSPYPSVLRSPYLRIVLRNVSLSLRNVLQATFVPPPEWDCPKDMAGAWHAHTDTAISPSIKGSYT